MTAGGHMAAVKQSDESKSKQRANQDLEDIETLRSNPAFKRYFERRVLGELEKARNEVLYNREIGKDEAWALRRKFLALYDISLMLLQDEAACRNILELSSQS